MAESSFDARLEEARCDGEAARAEFLAAYRAYLRILARDGIGDELQAKVDASDVAQDVLLLAQQGLSEFRGSTEAELLAWLRRMLANKIVDYARKFGGARRKTQERSIEDILYESSMAFEKIVVASGVSPSRHAQERESATILADALEELSPNHREVIRLRTMQGLSWEEIARRMSRSPDAARALWVRALKVLRPIVEKRIR